MAPRSARRTRVPVVSRDARARNRKAAAKPRVSLSVAEVGVIIVFTLLILFAVAVPLRNYFHVRADIADTTRSIQAKEAEKARLQGEIQQYDSDAFIREQARLRLGLVDKGETAFRILDPEMENAPVPAAPEETEEAQPEWWQTLWNAVSTPTDVDSGHKPAPVEMNMPIEPPVAE